MARVSHGRMGPRHHAADVRRAATAAAVVLAGVLAVGLVVVARRDDGSVGAGAVAGPPAGAVSAGAQADRPAGADVRAAETCATGCTDVELAELAQGAELRVNVGGVEHRDARGAVWSPGACEGGERYVSPNPIEGTDDDALFQARQFEARCRFRVEDGRYELILGWAETYRADAGYRVFRVNVEGRTVATVDVGKAAGMNRAYVRTVTVDVVDGMLDVEVGKVENRPMLAALAARRLGPVDTTPTTTVAPGPSVGVLTVGPGQRYRTLQAAVDAARPGDTVQLTTPGPHDGPVRSTRSGEDGRPITVTAVPGARLRCPSPRDGEVARCFELNHSWWVFDGFSIEGGSSNLYMVGSGRDAVVHDVVVRNSTFHGAPDGGTGECIRVKYHATRIEIAHNEIADCGLGKCCSGSKNGEAVYIGTAPEQLEDKNPTPEPDTTTGVWVHHNVMRPYNECVDIKEAAYGNLVEHNTCSGQRDPNSGAFGSRGGTPGRGNTFRFNLVNGALGACVRFGGDEPPDGTGNDFYGNVCRDIAGEHAVNQQAEPQALVCGNRFEGAVRPRKRVSRTEGVDAAAPCPATVDMSGAARPGAG